MKTLTAVSGRKNAKQERTQSVLFGLIEYYIKTGKPVGSNTLKEAGFEELSSATIRNYFAELEEEGYLQQQHTSGGRIPTPSAFRLYAETKVHSTETTEHETNVLERLRLQETRQIAAFLQEAAETLSTLSDGAVFMSAPRFDHDFITTIKMVPIDHHRCVAVMVTDFGVVQSEVFHLENKLSTISAKKIEEYFHWRLSGHDKPEGLDPELTEIAKSLYNELFIRYVIRYSAFVDEDVYRTGFSKLLAHPEFRDPNALAHSLAIFENAHTVRLLLRECAKTDQPRLWVGDDLTPYSNLKPNCAVIAVPYYINKQAVGAVGILGPVRMPYSQLYGLLHAFSENISEALTRNIYKFKIEVRQPSNEPLNGHSFLDETPMKLLENKP